MPEFDQLIHIMTSQIDRLASYRTFLTAAIWSISRDIFSRRINESVVSLQKEVMWSIRRCFSWLKLKILFYVLISFLRSNGICTTQFDRIAWESVYWSLVRNHFSTDRCSSRSLAAMIKHWIISSLHIDNE